MHDTETMESSTDISTLFTPIARAIAEANNVRKASDIVINALGDKPLQLVASSKK
jgi:hypothetical protein